jgi:sugar lactone lactonase YvrE
LGRILIGRRTSNNKFGGADGKTLFITADPYLARIRTVNAVAGK